MKADLRRLLKSARRRGWTVERTRGSHWKLRHPSGAVVVAGSTPSCPRAVLNTRADLRRIERRAP